MLCTSRLVLVRRAHIEISYTSKLKIVEKFSAISLYQMQKTTGIAGTMVIAICQNLQKPSFLEVIDSVVLLA